jgi:hypothetical protein
LKEFYREAKKNNKEITNYSQGDGFVVQEFTRFTYVDYDNLLDSRVLTKWVSFG